LPFKPRTDLTELTAFCDLVVGIVAKKILLGKFGRDLLERVVELAFVDREYTAPPVCPGDVAHPAFGRELTEVRIPSTATGAFEVFEVGRLNNVNLAVSDLKSSHGFFERSVALCIIAI
jgi:hypothetical protein